MYNNPFCNGATTVFFSNIISYLFTYVALSSMEAEYMALSAAARETLAWKQLFCELQIPASLKPVTILSDSQTALDIS